MELQKRLTQFIDATRVKTALIDIMAYAGDAGFYELIPKAIVQPVNHHEVKDLFAFSQQNNIPLTFRAGGTSLSGQSITDGILVDIGKHWYKVIPATNGHSVTVQPGVTGSMVNTYLKPFGRKIGPDPSSISAAMMGGILSNNASGMCCGVVNNSYHTLQTVHFILPNGNDYNTAQEHSYKLFEEQESVLCNVLQAIVGSLKNNSALTEKIRHKYKTKNTVGYSLNALLDYEHPLDIMAHLLIGAEGTLGFIAEATLLTLPNHPCNATAMLYFNNIQDACNAIIPLTNIGAAVLELMDRASLKSVEHLKGLPSFYPNLPNTAAALLCEFQGENIENLQQQLHTAQTVINALPLLHEAAFTQNAKEREFYWKIRKGMFPSVGAVRAAGTTVILEDIAFPVEKLAAAVLDLQNLFTAFNYNNAIIFGHAKDGNIHFVITQHLDTQVEIDRYDAFMQAVINLVLNKYQGALKAEHGTGRNMAPFVEAEWGGEAYEMMQQIKATIDPKNLLNPGVIINADAKAHIKNLKQLPQVEAEVDKCIECGMCEHHCPSKHVTLTPRQRIQVRRQLKKLEQAGNKTAYNQLTKEYQYSGLDTCATDGLCQSECPVEINTGELVKRLRKEQHSSLQKNIALSLAKQYAFAEKTARVAIATGDTLNHIFGQKTMPAITKTLKKIIPNFPLWMPELSAAKKLVTNPTKDEAVVYFSACINRIMGSPTKDKKSIQSTFVNVCNKAGITVTIPNNIFGHCCGQPFSSKGFNEAANYMAQKTIDAMLVWSNNGAIPVVCDFTSCTYTFVHNVSHLPKEYQEKFAQLQLIDIVSFCKAYLLPKLTITHPKENVVLHPTCAVQKMHLQEDFSAIATACSKEITIPKNAGCCGMAGDRGFLFPELTHSATLLEVAELQCSPNIGCYSTGHTCEMALTNASGRQYESILYLIDEVTS